MAKLTSFAVTLPLTAFLVAFLASCLHSVQAQTCYYPNGDISPNDSPCSTEGGACCPLNWECFSNGLCYLLEEDYYERHSCTDQNWEDEDCPNICTYDGSAAGNEAILLCDPSDEASWCCDANRVSFDCCTKSDATTFSLPFGTEVAVTKSEPSAMTSATASTTERSTPSSISDDGTSSTSDTSTTTSSSDRASSTSTSSTTPSSSLASTSTITLTAITSNSDGQVTTLTSISVVTTVPPSPTESMSTSPTGEAQAQHARKLKILAVSIAVPLGLIAIGLLFWILRRHQKHKARSTLSANPDVFFPPDPPQTQPKAELDSQQTTYGEKYQHDVPSELEGSPVLVNPVASPGPVAQTASYDPRAYRVSSLSPTEAATDVSRWSGVSSMGPPSNRQSAAGAAGLLAVGQQHYGGGGQPQQQQQQQQQYQPYRPPSGLPAPAELE